MSVLSGRGRTYRRARMSRSSFISWNLLYGIPYIHCGCFSFGDTSIYYVFVTHGMSRKMKRRLCRFLYFEMECPLLCMRKERLKYLKI